METLATNVAENDPNHYISAKELSDIEKELGEWVNKLNSNAKKGVRTEGEFTLNYHHWGDGIEVLSSMSAFPGYNNSNDEGEE